MKLVRVAMTLVVAAAIAVGVQADEEGQQKGKGRRQANAPSASQRLVAKLDLTAEQKEKVAEIDKQFAGRLSELQKKETALLTDEQKEARREAQKANREAKTTGAEARKALESALHLTDGQKEQMKEIQQARAAVNTDVRAALQKVLTAEQLEQLPKQGRAAAAKSGDKPKKKNRKANDSDK